MTLGLSMCWRGPPGVGKRHALQAELQRWAKSMGQLYVLKRQSWNAPLQGGDGGEDAVEVEEDDKVLLPMEVSVIHWGFDIARMSLQDKQYIKSILLKWGRGSQVLNSGVGNAQRCLVLYHAHLLSSESIIYIQAFLEENYQDTVLWMTSEHPLPPRLSDWCIEIPIASKGTDYALQRIQAAAPAHSQLDSIPTLENEIRIIYEHWMANPPRLSDVKKIRAVVYALLHRNIRWTDGFHHWLIVLDTLPLTPQQRVAAAAVCIKQPFTGSGQTVPSYRIPILWENYLCCLRNVLAPGYNAQTSESVSVTDIVKSVDIPLVTLPVTAPKKERSTKKRNVAAVP